jgi:hypothetical protein
MGDTKYSLPTVEVSVFRILFILGKTVFLIVI